MDVEAGPLAAAAAAAAAVAAAGCLLVASAVCTADGCHDAFPPLCLCASQHDLRVPKGPGRIKNTTKYYRAALKGTNLRGQTPICGFLRVPAVFCGFLRKSAVFCENLRFPNASFSR